MSGVTSRKSADGRAKYFYNGHSECIGLVLRCITDDRYEARCQEANGEFLLQRFKSIKKAEEWVMAHIALRRLRGQLKNTL
jgi:hypothetical protein